MAAHTCKKKKSGKTHVRETPPPFFRTCHAKSVTHIMTTTLIGISLSSTKSVQAFNPKAENCLHFSGLVFFCGRRRQALT